MSTSDDDVAGTLSEPSIPAPDKHQSQVRRWIVAVGATWYLLLLLTPLWLLVDDRATHRTLHQLLQYEDQWIVYRSKMEHAKLLHTLYRAAEQNPDAPLTAVQLRTDILHNRLTILASNSAATLTLRGVPEYDTAVTALEAALNEADRILAGEAGPALSAPAGTELIRIFQDVTPMVDALVEATVSRNISDRSLGRAKLEKIESFTVAAQIGLVVATLLFIGALVGNNRQAHRSRERLAKLSERLQRSESMMKAFLHHAPAIMSVKSLDGRYLVINPMGEQFFGRSAEAILGHKISDLLHESADSAETIEEMGRAVAATGDIQLRQIRRGTGPAQLWFAILLFPIQDSDGNITAVGGIGMDITEQKNSQEHALAAMKEAEDASRAKSELLANASHELRTPLNAILGFGEILQGQVFGPLGDARYKEYASDIVRSGQLLLHIVNEILDLSRIETGNFDLDEIRCDPKAILDAAASLVRQQAKEKGLVFQVDADDALADIHADSRVLTQVLVNLLSNAIKFTEPGGKVAISCRLNRLSGIEFVVSDNGIGIADDDKAEIFLPFIPACVDGDSRGGIPKGAKV